MPAKVIQFPGAVVRGSAPESRDARLRQMFRGKTKQDMRALWDSWNKDDPAYCGGYSIEDVHAYMNLIGDGAYCAV